MSNEVFRGGESSHGRFKFPFWNSQIWNGQHKLLPTTDSPTISTCTTATNLSQMDVLQTFGSVISNNRKCGTLEKNLMVAQPEIEPLQKKKQDDSIIYNETTITIEGPKPKIHICKQVITAISVSLVSLAIGFITAYTSPAEELLREDLNITKNEFSWISSLMPLSAIVGGLVGGQLIEYIGRKKTIGLTVLLFVITWILTACANHLHIMYVARSIAGFSVGISSLTLPVYLGETIQPEVRGTLGLLPTVFGNTGILLCFVVGSYLPWHELAWVGICLPVPFFVFMFWIPETPRWYVSKGKGEQARIALQWLRGATDVTEEFEDLVRAHAENEKLSSNSNLTDFFKRSNMKPLMISLGLMFFQQLSGINAVIFYTTSIFKMAGTSIPEEICTIIIGVVNFISTFIATILIDKLGRKVLLYISAATMFVTLSVLGVYFGCIKSDDGVSSFGWLPLTSLVVYVLGFSIGFGPVPWLMLGEILPAKIRGSAASLATSFNWACTFIVTKTFVDILNAIGPEGTFGLFAAICLIAMFFIYWCVPETQGKSLEDIERRFTRRISSMANLKTTPSTIS